VLSPRWRKVIRDLWSNKTRTTLVVLAIAVGIFAFGSVFITEEVLVTDMNSQYRSSNPSTITLGIRSFDDNVIRWAKRQKQVVDAQGRAVYTVKLRGEKGNYNLNLYAYESLSTATVNMVRSESGTWPPERREIVLERTSVPFSGAEIGDSFTIELSNGHTRELTFVGSVHDLSIFPANMFPQLSGYVSMETLRWLGLPSEYNQLEIVTSREYLSLSQIEEVADKLRSGLERTGISVDWVSIREPDQHWALEVTEGFTLILRFIGLFSLVLSGFLVVNTVSALVTEQRRQIGIMKAVGGTGTQITSLYLALVVSYGLLGLLVAVPVGMGLAYLFTNAVVQFINIDIMNFHLPMRVLILQAATAVLVPVIAAAIPVFGGVRTTVREATSSHGVGEKGKYGLFDRLLLRVRGLPRPVLLSLRNTFRRKGRLLLTLGALTIAGTLFITVINVRVSLMSELDNVLRILFNYDLELYLDGNYQGKGIEQRAEGVAGVSKAERRTSVQAQRIKSDGTKAATFSIIGLPPESDFVQPAITSGRWLDEKDRNSLVFSSNLIEEMPDVKTGQNIILEIDGKEYEWQVVGVMHMPWDRAAYADFDYVSAVKGESGLASSLYVRIDDREGRSQAEMIEVLEEHLKRDGIKVAQSITKDVVTSANSSQFDFLVSFLMSMAAMTALVGGLALAGMMSLSVIERTREIGVMRSIGAGHGAIGGIVIAEGLLISILSWALAIPLSIPINLIFNNMLGQMIVNQPLVFTFSSLGPVAWLAIVVVISVIASLLPAFRAMRLSIRDTLAYE
jgi:putative ABC transport system permease protein